MLAALGSCRDTICLIYCFSLPLLFLPCRCSAAVPCGCRVCPPPMEAGRVLVAHT